MKNFHIFVLLLFLVSLLLHYNKGTHFLHKCLDCLQALPFLGPRINPSQLECFADFLLLKKEKIRTEIFAVKEKEPGDDWVMNLLEPKWKIGRRIVLSRADVWGKHDNVEQWHIYERIMAETLEQTRATKCFEDHHEYVEDPNGNGLGLSDSMQTCLLDFLTKYKSLENIQHEAKPENVSSAVNAIKDNFKLVLHTKDAVLRWKVQESDKESLKYKRDTNEFRDLEKCQIKLFGENYTSNNAEVMDANKLLEYFNPNQLYLAHVPYHVEDVTVGELPAKTVSHGCSICLDDYNDEDHIRQVFPCQHAFHRDCLRPWLEVEKKSTCPSCRGKIKIDFREKAPDPATAQIQAQHTNNAFANAMMNITMKK